MNKEEVKLLGDRLAEISIHVPGRQWQLKYVLTFVVMELHMYSAFNRRSAEFEKALNFALSIPAFTSYTSPDFFEWIEQDEQYLKCMR